MVCGGRLELICLIVMLTGHPGMSRDTAGGVGVGSGASRLLDLSDAGGFDLKILVQVGVAAQINLI